MNNISNVLKRTLGLKKLQSTPFMVWMVANQRKVQLTGLIYNLKSELGGCIYTIIVTILVLMEHVQEAYSILLEKSLQKPVQAYHDWGNNALMIITKIKIVTLNILKRICIHPPKKPCNLDDNHD